MRDRRPFYLNPKFTTFLVLLAAGLFYFYLLRVTGQIPTPKDALKSAFYLLTFRLGKIPLSIRLLALDGVLFVGGIFLWLAFFAQFMLPLRSLADRYRAFSRLVFYLIGEHGPAIFIENGKVKERRNEGRRRGPGVIILDTASAAVVRDDFAFTRPVGPGVIFTHRTEYLAKSVDLHAQPVRLGPAENEDPFAPFDEENETLEGYQKRQERRTQTSGLTRDGVEVVPNVQVAFRLKRRPGDTSYSFGYNPIAVQQWVTADGPLATGASREADKWKDIPLQELPAQIAVDLWREYLQKFTLSELFTSPIGELERGETAYITILRMIQQRLTQPLVRELDSAGQPTGRKVPSREFATLRERGIAVLGASATNLRFEATVEARLVQQWVASWLQRAQVERNLVERQRSYAALQGREQALENFTTAAIQEFTTEVLTLPAPASEREEFIQMKLALERLVQGTLEGSLDPRYVQLLQLEGINLRDLLAWLGGQEP